MNAAALVLGGVAGLALAVWKRQEIAAGAADAADVATKNYEGAMQKINSTLGGVFDSRRLANMREIASRVDSVLASANVSAFLRVLRNGESGQGANAYMMRNGGGEITAPPWAHPMRKARVGTTSATGAYQFTVATWQETAQEMGLTDFSPSNQDRAAVGRIAYRGALNDVLAGRLDVAIEKCRQEWTSLPGAKEQLYTMDKARAVFAAYGGVDGGMVSI